MALVLVEGFEGFQTSDIAKKGGYTHSGAAIVTSSGRRSGRALEVDSVAKWCKIPFTALTTVYAGFAVHLPADAIGTEFPSSYYIFLLGNSDGNQLYFTMNNSRILCVQRGASTLLATSSNYLRTGWNFIEVQATANNTTGAVLVKIGGVTEINISSQDTLNTGSTTNFSYIQFSANWSYDTLFDDLWIDDAGLKGDCRIDVISPSGAGNSTQWTPSTGSNYACVDEIPGSATDYVQSSTANQVDTYAFGNLSALSTTIHATALNAMIKKTDSGSRGISPVTRSGGTDYVGSETSPTTSDLYMTEIRETDPDTAAAWDESGVNAAEFGVKLTT